MMYKKPDTRILQIGKYLLYSVGVLMTGLLLAGGQASVAAAPAIAQTFQASGDNITVGVLVGTKQGSPRTVVASSVAKSSKLVGVVAQEPLITLGSQDSSVEVVTSGVTIALVSDINGPIEAGDKITASPINGVGMLATKPTLIVGTAQASLEEASSQTRTIPGEEGGQQTVRVGRIPVDVSVTFYAATEVQQELVPPFLQNTANAIAGKPVSPVRVVAALMVMVLALVSVIVLLYSSVRSSIISIGRNPLSEKAVHKGLLEVGFTIIGILLLTFITVYLILVT